jgi:hypothetical protein
MFERNDFSDTDIMALKESHPVRGRVCCNDASDAGFDKGGLLEVSELGCPDEF